MFVSQKSDFTRTAKSTGFARQTLSGFRAAIAQSEKFDYEQERAHTVGSPDVGAVTVHVKKMRERRPIHFRIPCVGCSN
jgi:hypothetical protein